jgi:cytochrome P450
VNIPSNVAAEADPPQHIDSANVINYNAYEGYRFDEINNLYEGLHRMGEDEGRGIFWTPRNGGHWFINARELMFQAARDPGLFSSSKMSIPPMPAALEPRFIPMSLDPPEHMSFRRPLMKAFAPNVIKPMEARIRSLASNLIGEVVKSGRCEFVDALAEPVPVTVFMNMVGMPLGRLSEFRRWMTDISVGDNDARTVAFRRVAEAMGTLIAERQIERKDDLISTLLDAEIDGRPPTLDEMQGYCLLLFIAGLDTLINTFTFGIYQLAIDPGLQQRVKTEQTLIPELIEEILRRYAVAMPSPCRRGS